MTVAAPGRVREAAADSTAPRAWRVDVAVIAAYLALSFAVYQRLWANLDRRYLIDGWMDQNQWEWFFAVTAKHVTELDNPLFTTLQNHPLGVNLMANTVMLGLGVPLTPVTLAFGPTVTWALVLTFGMAGTGAAWYRLLFRHLGVSRTAAAVGGGFCAFAPPIISHGNAHPNFVVLFVIPLIIGRLVMLSRGERVIRNGLVLGLLVAYQVYLGEEVLLLAGTGLVIFAAAYATAEPDFLRTASLPLVTGGAVAAVVSFPLVAYPLAWQFSGPQSYSGLLHGPAGNDVEVLAAFAGRSLTGNSATDGPLAVSPTEQNAFFGWPLVVLVLAVLVWLRRSALVLALGVVILAATLLSLGPEIIVHGEPTGISGPWRVMARLPLYESVVESRLTLVCVPAIGVLLALATERARPRMLLWCLVLAEALVPIAPRPLVTEDRPVTPAFFTDGLWRQYVGPGRSIVPVPPPSGGNAVALRWQIDAGLGFALPEGYFVGPSGPGREGIYGAVRRPTSRLLHRAAGDDGPPAVTAADRAAAVADLGFWRADAVVLGPDPRQETLRSTVEKLLGDPGRYVGGVWVWDVRARR